MPFDTIFLDLDGTIIDSMPGIVNSASWALQHYGIDADPADLRMFAGPPLSESFRTYFDFDDSNVEDVVRLYRQRYTEKGESEMTLFSGVPEMLSALRDAGKTLIVASSKEENSVRRILDGAGLTGRFSFIAGASQGPERLSKGSVLRHACERAKVTDMERSVMVGDRKYDVRGAHEVGMLCAAVGYGYGSERELREAGADFYLETVGDLREWLLA